MKDAAAAAAMSDPEQNRWFRRRWFEETDTVAPGQAIKEVPVDDGLTLTGLALLREWREQRGHAGTVRR